MFERFSDPARSVLVLAEDEARRLGHGHIGTEHLLLGILAEGDSPAAAALVAFGATLDRSRNKVIEAVGDDDPARGRDTRDLQFTDRANRALERASRLSLRRRDARVDTQHILLCVLDVEGRAGQVLRGLAVDLVRLRAAVDPTAEDRSPAETADSVPTEVDGGGPHCPACGSVLDGVLAHRVVTSRDDARQSRDYVLAYCSACGTVLGVTTP